MVPKVRILIAALSLLLPLFARCMPAPWDVHPGGLRRGVEDLNPVAATRTKAVITARTDNHKRAPDSGLPFVLCSLVSRYTDSAFAFSGHRRLRGSPVSASRRTLSCLPESDFSVLLFSRHYPAPRFHRRFQCESCYNGKSECVGGFSTT